MTFNLQYNTLRGLAILLALYLAALPLHAHENTPTILDMTLNGTDVTVVMNANLEALISGTANEAQSGGDEPGAAQYLALRALSDSAISDKLKAFAPKLSAALKLSLDEQPIPLTLSKAEIPPTGNLALARTSTLTFKAILPAKTGSLTWLFPSEYGDSILRLFESGKSEPTLADFLSAGSLATIDLNKIQPQTTLEVIMDYIVAGFDHIVPKGLDHILFVIGLFLLSARLRPLLTQVTMFTLAHTTTLALGALGYISIPASIVEPLIAASIIFVAVENIFTEKLSPWRPVLIFGFGLLHGLGFASVLGDFGLPTGNFVPALIAFNVGVELGQLTVIAACFLAVGLWFRNKDWYHRVIVIPASTGIAIMATYWLMQRIGWIA